MTKPKTRRRVFLVNPRFQFRVIAYMLLTSAVVSLINLLAQRYFLSNLIAQGVQAGLKSTDPYFQFIDQQKVFLNQISLVACGACSMVILFAGILVSHRVAGPLFRLKNHLEQIAKTEDHSDRDTKDIYFRKGDYFPELAEAVNKAFSRRM